ncbi:MAG: histidine kinase [Pricia sp.]
MNRTKRFLFHIILWLAIWLMAWLLITGDIDFVHKNGPSFLMQIVVTAVLIYYTAPALLFKKKYVRFAVVSFSLIILCTFLISHTFIGQIDGMPALPEGLPPANHDGSLPGRRPIAPPQFLIHFLVLGMAYVLATFVETFLFAQKKEEETIRNKNENLQTELKLLKSQINPHFLFNSLNNIYALSIIDSGKTQQGISYLSNMLRYVLYECEQELVPLAKEVAYIENYIKLFTLKSSQIYPITAKFIIEDKSVKVAPMLFIPFMENALKHSNIEKITDTFIRIRLEADSSNIRFEVENSVPEIPVQKDAVGGIGLENVKKRLKILYPGKHRLNIKESATTYKVNLTIDLNGIH